jgi:N-methylhydantoinase A
VPTYRLGVDVGGTHTDLILLNPSDGQFLIEKVSSTPSNPAIAVLNGITNLISRGIDPGEIEFFGHGTTVTTNALLELKGSKVGLLITRGFRAVQEVQSQAREGNQFELNFRRPTPLVSQYLTREITGRLDHLGREIQPLDENEIREAAITLRKAGVDSIAICFLFSFMNHEHEVRAASIIRELNPDIFISLSSEVLPRIREWPRLSTTLLNAYLEPILARYAIELVNGLDGIEVKTQRRFLMQSNGGVMPISKAGLGGRSVHTLLSGPAAGVQATAYVLGEKQGHENLVTMDMGGTSCDIAFIQNAKPLEVTEGQIADRRLDIPAFDISTISAGGGTIARLGVSGLIRVGPDSAGAEPGPVAYGKGGVEPTVTDADLVCGFLNPAFLLGGGTSLNILAAEKAISSKIGQSAKMTARAAAAGIIRLINAKMADEIRVQAAKKVLDLKEFTLVPFGGAGPVHAAMVAEELHIPRVLIPPNPGAFSALGLLCSDIVHDYVRSELIELTEISPEQIEAQFKLLESQADTELDLEGLAGQARTFLREMDLRYSGQGYEIRTPIEEVASRPMSREGLIAIAGQFHKLHQQLHGHSARDQKIEVVSYRLRASVPVKKQDVLEIAKENKGPQPTNTREVTFDGNNLVNVPVYQRANLPSETLIGPAIIEQFDSTTLLPPRWIATSDVYGNILAERKS